MPVFGVTPDQDQIGRIQAEQVQLLLPRGGAVLCITGPAATSSSQRRLEALRARPGRQLPADGGGGGLDHRGGAAGARPLAGGAPTGADLPEVVCAQNDEMALGARQALRDAASRRDLPQLVDAAHHRLRRIAGGGAADGAPESACGPRWWSPPPPGRPIEWLARWREGGRRRRPTSPWRSARSPTC